MIVANKNYKKFDKTEKDNLIGDVLSILKSNFSSDKKITQLEKLVIDYNTASAK